MDTREKVAKHLCNRGAGCEKHWDSCADKNLRELYLEQADQILSLVEQTPIEQYLKQISDSLYVISVKNTNMEGRDETD